jgi:hypothetical protein
VHCENLLIDDGRDWQAVEAISESLPEFDIIPPLALIVKTIDTIDRCAFVVAAENEEVFRILDLVGQKKANSLKRLLASVNIISKEEIVCLRRKAAILEQTKKIVVLSVDITADL